MTKLISKIFKAANIFVVFLYLLACTIPFLPSGKYWVIQVLGLMFPILFFIVAVFLIGWAIARSKWMLLSLVAILLSWKQLSVVVGLNKEQFNITKTDTTLRVFTWNVSSWGETNKSRMHTPNSGNRMIDFVKDQQADVLCFQEFYDFIRVKSNYSIIRTFKEMGYNYSYFVKTSIGKVNYKTGVAILSRYPIVDTAKFLYGEKDYAEHLIYADILYKGKKVRVFTTHLQSVRFEGEQYASLRKIRQTDETGLKGSETIVKKLKIAYQYRGAEADLLREKINESPYPAIVCGDFNDVPNSYTYFKVKGDMQDAFLVKGNKFGRTFRYLSPTLRIDYIFADRNFSVEQFSRIIAPYSDHYPVVADLKLAHTGM